MQFKTRFLKKTVITYVNDYEALAEAAQEAVIGLKKGWMKQKDLAKKVWFTEETISKIKNWKYKPDGRSYDTVIKILTLFDKMKKC